MNKKILVPLDGTVLAERAIPVAAQVARRTGAELHPVLVHLTDYLRGLGAAPATVPEADRALALRENEYMAWARERIASEGVKTRPPVLLHGDVPDAVVEHVARQGIDGVVMATHGRGTLEQLLVPSVAEGLRHRLAVPMIMVRVDPDHTREVAAAATEIRTALVALDGSPDAEAALDAALGILGPEGRCVLLRVVSLPPLLSSVYLPQATILRHRDEEQLKADAAEYLSGVEARVRERNARVEKRLGVHSRPGHLIARAAEDSAADLIAVGSHGHGKLREALFGSVTRDVLDESRVPVLVTRASG